MHPHPPHLPHVVAALPHAVHCESPLVSNRGASSKALRGAAIPLPPCMYAELRTSRLKKLKVLVGCLHANHHCHSLGLLGGDANTLWKCWAELSRLMQPTMVLAAADDAWVYMLLWASACCWAAASMAAEANCYCHSHGVFKNVNPTPLPYPSPTPIHTCAGMCQPRCTGPSLAAGLGE